jgi:hypothetical protein
MPGVDQFALRQIPVSLFYATAVNLKAIGVTDIFTVPSGMTFILVNAYYLITQNVGSPKGPVAHIRESGGNLAMTDNAPDNNVSMAVGFKAWPPDPDNNPSRALCAAGNKVQFEVTALGAGAGPLVATVAVTGFLVPI